MIAVAAVVLILLVGWWLLSGYSGGTGGSVVPGGPESAAVSQGPVTRLPAPSGISVPNATSLNVPANVAKPSAVTPAGPNRSASFRKFSISVSGNQFTPSDVIVNVGDTVHLDITAADKEYDFAQPDYGYFKPLPKSMTTPVEFQATAAGKFTFYCRACGGPAKGPVGYIIVVGSR